VRSTTPLLLVAIYDALINGYAQKIILLKNNGNQQAVKEPHIYKYINSLDGAMK